MYEERKILEVTEKIRDISSLPFVLSVSNHFAGYWDELGLTIS
jgi:hypothetical protein